MLEPLLVCCSCYSYVVGRQGGEQVLYLKRQGCLCFDTVQHKLLQALDLGHEQQRSNRDIHTEVYVKNVEPGESN